jgi:hypothetical protein
MQLNDIEVDYCGISNQNDFYVFESIITFKYKIINTKKQLSKICDFITDYKSELDYDWYMKIRPEIKLLDTIPFDILSENAINARARVYNGPLKIKYGMSVNGDGCWNNVGDYTYAEHEHDIVLDDMLYIFHKNIVLKNAFDKVTENAFDRKNLIMTETQHEWIHTDIFNKRNIPVNVIGINLCFIKNNTISGNIQ